MPGESMTTRSLRTVLTPRDLDILTWIGRSPLTVEQLLKVSSSFAVPFQSDSRVRGRLSQLREAGWVQRYRYAMSQRGTPADYYKLTLAGYRILHGDSAGPPTKRHFHELKIGRHHHAQSLAEVLVHTAACAHRSKLRLSDVFPENTLRLELGHESLFPDGAFQLTTPQGQSFNFCLELDCGTERLRSGRDRESIERKVHFYDRYQDTAAERFRVLFVVTRNSDRLRHILETAKAVVRNPRRSLCYGVLLQRFLAEPEAATIAILHNHHLDSVALVPEPSRTAASPDRSRSIEASELVIAE